MPDAAACYEQIRDLREEMGSGFRRIEDLLREGEGRFADHDARIRRLEESDTHPALPAIPAITPTTTPAPAAAEPAKPHWIVQAIVNGISFSIGGALVGGAIVLLQHSAKGSP